MALFRNQLPRCRTLMRVFMFISVFLLPDIADARDSKVILPAREASVRTAFEEVQRQSGYSIAVNWEYLDPERRVFFAASSLTAAEIMTQALAGTGLSWQLIGDRIVVGSEREPELHSVMHRTSLPQRMTVVHDQQSEREMTPDEISQIRSGYWRSGENGPGTDSISLAMLNFRVNKADLERDYMDNAYTLDMIRRTFSNKELLSAMDFITVTAAASPEGNTAFNAKLAADRAKAVKSYIMWKYPFMDRNRIFTFSIGEDWSGLYKMVSDDDDTPYRTEILEIIGGDADSDSKRSRLKSLGGGAAYRYIAAKMLPYLRGAAACMIYYKEDPQPIVIVDTVRTHSVDTVYVDRPVVVEKTVAADNIPIAAEDSPSGRYYWAVKTNLLYDALLLPDLAFEFSLPRRWSIEAGGQWSWWNSDDPKHYYHRIQFAGIEVRKWLGDRDKTPLTGHFIGLYGMGGNYDLKFGPRGILCDGMSWSVGVTYGYSMPIARRLNLEFSLGIGYLWGEYKKYTWNDEYRCYPWEGTYDRNYIGPTKAEISLVWLIGSGTNPLKKR